MEVVNGIIVTHEAPGRWFVHRQIRGGVLVDGQIVPDPIVERRPVYADIAGVETVVDHEDVVIGYETPEAIGGYRVSFNPDVEGGDTAEIALRVWTEAQNTPAEPDPVPRWYVSRLVVVDRLEAAGKRIAAKQALSADDYQQDRWNAATEIASDDAGVRALLTSVGADPDQILAPT